MGGFLNGALGILGAGMDIYGQFRQQHQQNWENGLTMEQFNRRNAAQDRGVESWNASADPARDSSLQLRDLFMAALSGDSGSQAQLQQLLQQYPGMIDSLLGGGSDPFGRGINGGMDSVMNQNLERRGVFGSGGDQAMGIFGSGGYTDARNTAQERFTDYMNGQGKEMGTLGDVGSDLLGQRGQSAISQGFQDRGMDSLNAGGMNQYLSGLMDNGSQMFANQGFNAQNQGLYGRGLAGMDEGALGTAGLTQAGGMAELVGLQDLQNGGQTDLSTAMAQRGLDLAGRESLLPMNDAFQFAREDAARNTEGAFKRAQRQALARRGGSASVVAAGGAEGDPMSEWADQASRSVSDAGRAALLGQQGLNLTQQGQGIGMAGNAGQLENSRYGAAAGLVGNMEANATQRYQANAGVAGQALNNALGYAGLGSQSVLGGQNAATNNMGTLGGLAMNAGQLENSRMGTGINALQAYNQNRIAGGGLMNQSLQDQQNYALGAGSLANTFENSYQGAGNNYFAQQLAGGQFGQGLNRDQMSALTQYINSMQGYNNANTSGAQLGINNLYNLAGQGLSYAQAGLTGQNYGQTPVQNMANPWSSLGQGIAGSNLGGLFGNNNSGGGGGGFNQYDPLAGTWQGKP